MLKDLSGENFVVLLCHGETVKPLKAGCDLAEPQAEKDSFFPGLLSLYRVPFMNQCTSSFV